jgi:hypothetical protein
MEADVATELTQRINGSFSLRLILQPCMALLFAFRDGRQDAKDGASPYLQSVHFQPRERRETFASAWASVGKVMTIAFVLDCVFQFVSAGNISVIEALIMALLLCAVPYTLARGPAARLMRR